MHNVLVTGGSKGLGLGIARRLALAGYQVIAIARTEGELLAAAMLAVEKASSGSLRFAAADLGDLDAIPALIRMLRKQYGPVYGLINNAALGTDGLLATMKNSDIERLVRLNTLSPILVTKYVARSMVADGGGRIVNVASIIGFTGFSGLSVYAATKAAMLGFTHSLAREVGRSGVNVNAVAPGFMDTEMTSGLVGEKREKVAGRSALRRLPEVDDVAGMVEFLLGDGGRNITGAVMTIDAGSTA
jgi:3-oxoacyl-[acyl-carrier protein] reductase